MATTNDDYWSPEPIENGAVAEWMRQPEQQHQAADTVTKALGPSGYASRDQLALTELVAIVGRLAETTYHLTAAADVPDPDRYPELSCDGLMAWLTDLAAHMRTESLSLAEVHLRLQVEERQQRDWTAESTGDGGRCG